MTSGVIVDLSKFSVIALLRNSDKKTLCDLKLWV